ncbi:MAG: hypothetical protein ACLSFR_09680 [Alphaproteobacteria bacterium]
MKYFKFVCYSLLLMLLFNTSSLYAAPPLEDHTTHTPLSLMPEPLSGSHDTLKLAATWWLPDWQGSQGSRGSDDVGGGDHDGNCEKNYGMHTPSNIDGRYICSKYNYNVTSSLKCHVNCRCKDEYKYTSSNCSGKYTVSGSSCEGKYNACVCKSEYSQNSSNCNGEYRPAGESCDGNYNRCEMRPECAVSSLSCTAYGCASTNSCGRCISCKTNPDCDVSSKSCVSLGCASYNSCNKCVACNTDPCSGVSCGSNAYCSGGSCYCNSGYKKCNGSCISNSSCCGGCSSNQTCTNGSCVTNTPSDPCAGVSCGSNAYCSGGSCYCNSGYEGNASSGCTAVSKDPCKGVSCSGGKVCSNGSCVCPSGKKECNGSCISSSECCGGCPSGKKCSNGTCVTDHTHSYSCPSGSQASSCSSSQVQTGTPSKVCSCGATSGTCYTCRAKTCEEQGYRYACNNTGYVGKGSPCDGKYKECDCAPGYQWLPTYPGSREQTCQIPDKTCSDSGYYGGSSCSSWSGYSFERCASEYGQMGSSCNAAGNVGSGSCDVDSGDDAVINAAAPEHNPRISEKYPGQ